MVGGDLALALKLQQEFDEEYAQSSAKEETTKIISTSTSDKVSKMGISDYNLALKLQEEEKSKSNDVLFSTGNERKRNNGQCNLSDGKWEQCDPTPDARSLFVEFDKKYFWGKLASVEVVWSNRMTLCAGLCEYHGSRSGICTVKLSEPLLKYRSRSDLLETLLHEMIHAYLFLTNNNRDRDGHGPEFQKHMHRLNKETGLNITIYHTFHDEVALYQQHWWLCDGPCRHKHPFYGYVKRAMNRPPSKADRWWIDHFTTCGGTFHKVKEPEKSKEKKEGVVTKSSVGGNIQKIDFYFEPIKKNQPSGSSQLSTNKEPPGKTSTNRDPLPLKVQNKNIRELTGLSNTPSQGKSNIENHDTTFSKSQESQANLTPFSGRGFQLGTSSKRDDAMSNTLKILNAERLERLSRKRPASQSDNGTSANKIQKLNDGIVSKQNVRPSPNTVSGKLKKSLRDDGESNQYILQGSTSELKLLSTFQQTKLWPEAFSSKIKISDPIDITTCLRNPTLEVGEMIRIPTFVSVSSSKHNMVYEKVEDVTKIFSKRNKNCAAYSQPCKRLKVDGLSEEPSKLNNSDTTLDSFIQIDDDSLHGKHLDESSNDTSQEKEIQKSPKTGKLNDMIKNVLVFKGKGPTTEKRDVSLVIPSRDNGSSSSDWVLCPICSTKVKLALINGHLDRCLQ